jgi:hypothetical protein
MSAVGCCLNIADLLRMGIIAVAVLAGYVLLRLHFDGRRGGE